MWLFKCEQSLGILISGNVELHKSKSIKLVTISFLYPQMHKVDPK